jgi:endonuclease/exonuclease/phosphatase family metal-dependent hydrolase
MAVKVISYNIHGGWGLDGRHDYARINSLLEAEEADIVLLQEVDTRPPARSTAQDIRDLCGRRFPHFLAGKTIENEDGWYGNAVMSRFEILGHETVDISMPGFEPRNIMEVVIRTPDGVLRVLNTHKGLNHGERRRQFEKLHTLLVRENELPVLVGGDLNEWQTSTRALRELNRFLKPVRLPRTFPVRFPLFHLDRLWCRPENLIREATVLKNRQTRLYSDHFPVCAQLRLENL